MSNKPIIFLSHADENCFEANLFQTVLENLLADLNVIVWSYKRDQSGKERNIGGSLKEIIKKSSVFIFLVSPHTLDTGATQWMELAYADTYEMPIFILLHQLTFEDLKKHDSGVPPLLLAGSCILAVDWKKEDVEAQLRKCL